MRTRIAVVVFGLFAAVVAGVVVALLLPDRADLIWLQRGSSALLFLFGLAYALWTIRRPVDWTPPRGSLLRTRVSLAAVYAALALTQAVSLALSFVP